MKIATLGLVAAISAGFAGTALAGVNARGHLLLHTDDSVIYSEDDAPTYCDLLLGECPSDPECDDDHMPCQSHLMGDLNVASGRDGTLGEVSMIWALAAFPAADCPRVKAVTFALTWSLGENQQPVFAASGTCGQFEIATQGWLEEPGSGVGVTFDPVIVRTGFPIYWFAAYNYYGPTMISIAAFPSSEGASFADDSIPAIADRVTSERWGSVGLNGAIGSNPYPGPSPTIETSWGEVKAIFGR
jgi:hypothetical protein